MLATDRLMAHSKYVPAPMPFRDRAAYQAQILRVLARTDFKLKYAGSVLGYVWSVAKPLLYFAVLWIVFGKLFKPEVHRFPLYLVLGLVLWTFVADAVSATLPSIVARGSILRRIAFPPIVIPVAATITAVMTFVVNLAVVVVFIAAGRVEPNVKWLILIPLFLWLYVFVLGLSLAAATLYVRFRDVGQIWDAVQPILFFSAPIMYPVTILPVWARHIIVFNPFVAILQDVRRIVLGPDAHAVRLIGFHGNHLIPLGVTAVLLTGSFWLYRRNASRFAELA
jgi:ABC-2 type transport system permease protein